MERRKRHPMHDFGTVSGITQEVRINRLESRLTPRVPFPHRHDSYHLVFVTSGHGWHEIDFNRYTVAPLRVFFMHPRQVHSWQLEKSTAGFVVEFGVEAMMEGLVVESIPSYLSFSSSRLNLPSWNTLLTILKLMIQEYESETPGFERILRHYLVPLLAELSRSERSSRASKAHKREDPIIDHFLKLVEEYFRTEHRVAFYAKRIKVSPKAITMRMIRSYGKSARRIIHERCLLEGKRLLAYSNFTVSEVGYRIGFDDPNYFSRFFKNETGFSPGEFREEARKRV